mmetsp:Transcript_28912/g.84398  ORF Transcript_28912/g.84398 Transcript_28912/m.84398 type:complete len:200 (-) Transcript_28912:566-1165(-)
MVEAASCFLELHISEGEDAPKNVEHRRLLICGEPKRRHAVKQRLALGPVVHPRNRAVLVGQILEVLGDEEFTTFRNFINAAGAQMVEHVKAALVSGLTYDTRLFQKKVGHATTNHDAGQVELQLHVLAKAARVVIPSSLGVAKGFQQRRRVQELSLHSGGCIASSRLVRLALLLPLGGHDGDKAHDMLCSFRLARTTLS